MKRELVYGNPWFRVVAKHSDASAQPHYALELADYVGVLALTADGQVILVRQYRPVLERETLELPSGTVDAGETPQATARRELIEETGYEPGELTLLGELSPDVGRLGNRLWCFAATNCRVSATPLRPEETIESVSVPTGEFRRMLAECRLDNALNYPVVLLAQLAGLLDG